ncbi:MAG: TldD/PmbA family protein [Vulcanimicrobiaceae bacterium]
MREAEREALARRILELAPDGCEAIVSSEALGLTRFTHNAIHQNISSADTTVRIRALADGRTGVAVTNDLCDEALARTVARANEIATLSPRDDGAVGFARCPRPNGPAGAYVAAAAVARASGVACAVAAIFGETAAASLWAAGYVTTSHAGVTIANGAGTLVSYDGTTCGLNVKANGPDSTGYAEYYGTDVSSLDGLAAGRRAVAKVRAGVAPRAVDPGAWTVVLEPAAIGELLSYLTEHFSAQAFEEGSSFLCDGLDRTYAGENVTMWDDFAHPLLAGMPFDFEGRPRTRVPLLDAGVARELVTDARYAARMGRRNTGHGLPAPSAAGPQALHVVVAGGDKSVEQLIAETHRGLLVSRFWYIRPVDARKTIVTGMTRDGTFLIEDGRVTRGVRNLRFNQSILESLRACEFAREAVRTAGYGYAMIVPAVKIADFRFTSTTEF